jgi:hypothetical protein
MKEGGTNIMQQKKSVLEEEGTCGWHDVTHSLKHVHSPHIYGIGLEEKGKSFCSFLF